MSGAVYTPKQIAQALGVSESSVKRWVDSGKLAAAKTVGGHRKVPIASIVKFIRDTNQPIAEPSVLGMVAAGRGGNLEGAQRPLFEALVQGREPDCRELVLAFYQRGESVVRIGDHLIGPAFEMIGDGWAEQRVEVHQERRACEVMMATLHDLRRWLPTADENAPLALVATPHQDFAEVPARLVELALLEAGWRVVVAGSGLPLAQIRAAVLSRRPQLVCLSATHLEEPSSFVAEFRSQLVAPLKASELSPAIAIGGTAIDNELRERIGCDLIARCLQDLANFVAKHG